MSSSVRDQILEFRLAELHEAASRLGLTKTGRKAGLQARLLAYFGEAEPTADRRPVQPPQQQWRVEQAARVVREIYCRMKGIRNSSSDQSTAEQFVPQSRTLPTTVTTAQGAAYAHQARATAAGAAASGAVPAHARVPQAVHPPVAGGNHPARAGAGAMRASAVRTGGALQGRYNTTIRCICHVQTERGQMIQCEDPTCGVWQHCDCLGMVPPQGVPRHFFCETCRARLADPFWEAQDKPLLAPCRLKPQARPAFLTASGSQEQLQTAEHVFYLEQRHMDLLTREPDACRLQVGCLQVQDEVGFRYHWPRHVDLRINNMQYRPYTRAPNIKMGINQRDEPASIGSLCVRGRNSVTVHASEPGIWVLLVQIARKRSSNQVKAHMSPPESLVDAMGRVRRMVSGGADDTDDEDGILISHQVVSLKDPMSGQRMKIPARFRDASGLQCFDLDTFLTMVERNRKWQDPTTLRNSTLPQLQIDTYMLRVLQCLALAPHVNDVELSADGRWRPAGVDGPWFDIQKQPHEVVIQGPVVVKPDPDGGNVAANGDGGGEVLSDSSDDEDPHEELRQAARAVAAQWVAGQKRKEPEEPEVIDLLDSSDDERPAPAARAQPRPAGVPIPAQPPQQPHHHAHHAQQPRGPVAQQPQHAQQPRTHMTQQSQAYPPQQQAPAVVVMPAAQPLKIRLPIRRLTQQQQQQQQQAQQAQQQAQQAQQARQRALDAVNASRQLAQAGGAAMPPQQVHQQEHQQQLGVASPTHRVTSPTTLERLASLQQQQLQHQQQPSQSDLAAYNQLRQGGYIPHHPAQQPLQQQAGQPSSLVMQFAMGGYMQQLGGPVAVSAAAPGAMYSTYPLAQPMGMPSAPGTAPVQMVPTPMATTGPPAYLAAAPAMPLAAPSLPPATVAMPLQGVPASAQQPQHYQPQQLPPLQQLPPQPQRQLSLPPPVPQQQQQQRAGPVPALQGRPASTGPGGSDEALDAYLQLLDRQNQSGDFTVDSLLND